MNDLKKNLIKLHHCRGVGWKTIYSILQNDPQFLSLTSPNSATTFGVSKEILSDFLSSSIQEQINQYAINNIHIITYFDANYPSLLKEIYQPPWVLYAKGDISLLHAKRKLSIVGSRTATSYSLQVIETIIDELVDANTIIVSGLAKGVDSIAHKATIKHHGKTIGVIAGGFFHIYPSENRKLAEEMMENHLVLSEYPPFMKPQKWQFPMRNRIISGITNGTLVVEAKKKSGSLITANYALNEGRDVFAIPGNIYSSNSMGTNDLIRQGAKPVLCAGDILEEWEYK